MTNQATLELLTTLRLWGMKNAFSAYLQTPTRLTNDELVAHLTEAEQLHRHHQRLKRLMKNAHFRYQATMADIDFDAARGLDKNLVLRLAQATFIQQAQPIIITGPTGVGKSFIASALGQQACLLGFRTLYVNTRKLFHQLHQALADNSYARLIRKIEKQDLLILDDFALHPMKSNDRNALMEIIEDRHQKKATILIAQLPVAQWHDWIGDSAIADAVLDRLVHQAHRIELKGESLRKRKSKK